MTIRRVTMHQSALRLARAAERAEAAGEVPAFLLSKPVAPAPRARSRKKSAPRKRSK